MTPTVQFYLSAFIIISLELILMVTIFMLQPRQPSNRLFALYMLMLATNSYTILVSSTASDILSIFGATKIHALATMLVAPLLWLLVLQTFIPQHQVTRWLKPPLFLLLFLPLFVAVIDWLRGSDLLFVFQPEHYSGGYVRLSAAINGRLSQFFYLVYIRTLNSILTLPLIIFAFSGLLPDRLRRAARVLLLLSASVALLYLPWLDIPPALRSMLTPIFAALGAAWVVSSYRVFSPMELAMNQVVNAVTIGLLVFDEQLNLRDANASAAKLLPLGKPEDFQQMTLPLLFERLRPAVQDQAALTRWQHEVEQEPERAYSREIVLGSGPVAGDSPTTWLLFNLNPVYDGNGLFLGLSCTIEDLTDERTTQAEITAAKKSVEQYAYNQTLLNDITQAAISSLEFEETLSILAERLAALFEADQCYIALWDETLEQPVPTAAFGVDAAAYRSIQLAPGESSLTAEVCRLGKAMAVEDMLQSNSVSRRVSQMFPTRGMLALPMIASEQILGALLIGFNQPRRFSEEEIRWGEQISHQLTLAIYKNQLLETEREHRIMLEALQAAGQVLTGTLDFDEVLNCILDEIAKVIPYDMANFALVKNDEAHFVRTRGFDKNSLMSSEEALKIRLNIWQTPTLRTMQESKRPLCLPNVEDSELWIHIDPGFPIKSWMGVPLVVADQVIAFLSVDKFAANFYRRQHEEWLAAFASQAALALQNAQLFTELQRRVTELEALSTISAVLRSSDPLPVILQSVIEEMVEILSATLGVIFLVDEEETAVISHSCYPKHVYPNGIRYAMGEGITGHVARTGDIYIAADIYQDPIRIHLPDEPEIANALRSSIALPLISGEAILGVIHLGLNKPYQFADDEIRTLKAITNIVANGLQRMQVMQTLEARVASRTFELESANERLQELDKLKSKFIADVSHELRTPVTNLSLYVNLLQHGKPGKQDHYMMILQQQANRLTSLVEATLGLSRLEIGAENLSLGPVELNEVVEEIVQGHQARAEALGLKLATNLQVDLPVVKGNMIQLAQLVTNLLTNAINYTPKGTIRLETEVAVDQTVCLKVSDSGIGIAETELPHLFERFYRGHRTGQSNIPGTGLGLAIVKEIVELHHGRIDVQSQLHQGSTFRVNIPIYVETEPVEEAMPLPVAE